MSVVKVFPMQVHKLLRAGNKETNRTRVCFLQRIPQAYPWRYHKGPICQHRYMCSSIWLWICTLRSVPRYLMPTCTRSSSLPDEISMGTISKDTTWDGLAQQLKTWRLPRCKSTFKVGDMQDTSLHQCVCKLHTRISSCLNIDDLDEKMCRPSSARYSGRIVYSTRGSMSSASDDASPRWSSHLPPDLEREPVQGSSYSRNFSIEHLQEPSTRRPISEIDNLLVTGVPSPKTTRDTSTRWYWYMNVDEPDDTSCLMICNVILNRHTCNLWIMNVIILDAGVHRSHADYRQRTRCRSKRSRCR